MANAICKGRHVRDGGEGGLLVRGESTANSSVGGRCGCASFCDLDLCWVWQLCTQQTDDLRQLHRQLFLF